MRHSVYTHDICVCRQLAACSAQQSSQVRTAAAAVCAAAAAIDSSMHSRVLCVNTGAQQGHWHLLDVVLSPVGGLHTAAAAEAAAERRQHMAKHEGCQ
jgi:hypothetical protein